MSDYAKLVLVRYSHIKFKLGDFKLAQKVLVLAENFGEVVNYVKNNNLNMKHFEYSVGKNTFSGYRGVVILLGRWWRNPAYESKEFFGLLNYYKDTGSISCVKVQTDKDDDDFMLLGSFIVAPLPSSPQLAYS